MITVEIKKMVTYMATNTLGDELLQPVESVRARRDGWREESVALVDQRLHDLPPKVNSLLNRQVGLTGFVDSAKR